MLQPLRFVVAVAIVLACDAMPLGLPDDAQRGMSNACGASLTELQGQAQSFGCML